MVFATLIIAAAVTLVPTPPPTIVTIKSSPLCNVVRSVIAPTIAGLRAQDAALGSGQSLLRDMARMQNAGGTTYVKLDNVRLLDVIDGVAANNVKIHQLLDSMDSKKLHTEDAAAVAELRAHLIAIADRQAGMLNAMSESALSYDANQLNAAGEDVANSISPLSAPHSGSDTSEAGLPEQATRDIIGQSDFGGVVLELSLHRQDAGTAESHIASALAPMIDRCR